MLHDIKMNFFSLKEEELDEQNVQISPPGFHVIFLPFADDLRKLDYPDTLKGLCVVTCVAKHC